MNERRSPSVPGRTRVEVAERCLNTYYKLRSLLYAGDALMCPCCGESAARFMPYGGQPNRLCPRCRSFERHRLMWTYFQNKTDLLTATKRVFHVAPHYIIQKRIRELPNVQEYVSADVNSLLAMMKVNIENIPYPPDYFDVIICSHVLEHVDNDQEAMRELYRVLKPGGFAYLPVPLDEKRDHTYEDPTITDPEERERAFGQWDHVRLYGLDYFDRLEKAGFTPKIDAYAQTLDAKTVDRFRLNAEEKIYLGLK